MKNYISKDDLANDLLYETLCALSNVLCAHNLDLTIVGASARDIGMKLLGADESKRRTADLDVAVALRDWSQYESLSESLQKNHFKKLKSKQKFSYEGTDGKNDYEVDVVPFGEVADDEIIKWPPMGVPEMSVRCYGDVMKNALDVEIGDIHVKIASLAGQFLIKLDTWIDRNDRVNKDAIDMRFILSQYYMANVMTYDSIPDVIDLDSGDTLLWGAQWIGFETSKMLSTEHLSYYADFLRQELSLDERSRLLQHFNVGKDDYSLEWESTKNALGGMLNVWEEELGKRMDSI